MGYVLYWGISPDKLNNSVMIYDKTTYELRALNKGVEYHFAIEAFNENGISECSEHNDKAQLPPTLRSTEP